jgi:hypothetical protein
MLNISSSVYWPFLFLLRTLWSYYISYVKSNLNK